MWKISRIGAAALCLAACLTAAPPHAAAATPDIQSVTVYDADIMPLMEYISNAGCVLSVRGSSVTVNASVSGNFSLATKCQITVELQEKSLLTWKTVATWGDTQNGALAAVNESCAVTAGKSYRAVATVTVWNGSASETQTVTSNTVKV